MTTPRDSPPKSEPDLETQNPNSASQNPQSPQTLTLDNTHQPNQTTNQPDDQSEDDPKILDQDHHDPDHQSGNSSLSPPFSLRRTSRRKKGAVHKKRQQAIEKNFQTLVKTLNPIPFFPAKTLDFDRHEELLKRLGLWDFVHIEFDPRLNKDFIAELIVNYDPKLRYSYVGGYRIQVNRPALGRALSLPMRREKGGSGGGEPVVLNVEEYGGEVSTFIEDLLSNWLVLHGDMWSMTNDVLSWTRDIKDGKPEKADWAGLAWFMVEKELSQGVKLTDCYYASHLQYLIKSQRANLFANENVSEEEVVVEEPNVELTLGKEKVEREEGEDRETVEVEESKDGDLMVVDEGNDEVEQGDWVSDGKNSIGDHFLRRCDAKEKMAMDGDEESKDWVLDGKKSTMAHFLQPMNADEEGKFEEEGERNLEEEVERTFVGGDEDEMKLEEEEEDAMKLEEEDLGDNNEEEEDEKFSLTPKIHGLRGDGFEGNLLQGIDADYGVSAHFDDQSNMGIISPRDEPYSSPGGPSFFGNGKRREISHDHDLLHDLDRGNKRLRTDGSSSKSSEFDVCMDQIQLWVGKAKALQDSKEKDVEQLSKNQQILINEIQQRDNMIEHMHKMKYEEMLKKDEEIYRLDRELYVMGNLINGYRNALKATRKDFSEYREKCQLAEEPIYKDVGPGGLVLSTMEIERQRVKREEEDRANKAIVEHNIKQFEEESVFLLEGYFNRVQMMDTKLLDLENEVSQITEVYAKGKVLEAVDLATPVE